MTPYKKKTPKPKAVPTVEVAAAQPTTFRNDPATMGYDNWKFGDPVGNDAPDEIKAKWYEEYKRLQSEALAKMNGK